MTGTFKNTTSSFDEFAQDALRVGELSSIAGGIEKNDDFDSSFDERDEVKRMDKEHSRPEETDVIF